MRIGQIASQASVNIQTTPTCYERRGTVAVTQSRIIRISRLRAGRGRSRPIHQARPGTAGLTLHEIAELLALRVRVDRACAEVEARGESAPALTRNSPSCTGSEMP